MNTRRLKFVGVPFPEHAPKYIVPGLGLRQMREAKEVIGRLMELQATLTAGATPEILEEAMGAAVKLVHAAILRNHESVTLEEIEDLVDMNNFQFLIAAIMGQSGFKLVSELPKEVAESGEA